jgi:pyruvate dehydrogenase (quinone)
VRVELSDRGKSSRSRQATVNRPAAMEHDGPALIEAMVSRYELSMPPTITLDQVKGFTLFATRSVLSGRGDELIDLAETNVARRVFS